MESPETARSEFSQWRDEVMGKPGRHEFAPNCGSREGLDECWWCFRSRIEHDAAVEPVEGGRE